jgi:hypothetical protein
MAKIIRDADGNITGTVTHESGCLDGCLGTLIFLGLLAVVAFALYGLIHG